MSANVKMLAVVDGEEVEIGRCHPGQARLLRKKGLAEWRDGKVWLNAPPEGLTKAPDEVPVDPWNTLSKRQDALLRIERDGERVVAQSPWQRPALPASPEYMRAIIKEAGIEPGDWLDHVKERGGSKYKDVVVSSFPALLHEFLTRVGLGHETCADDDPRNRAIGFLDHTTEEFIKVPGSAGTARLTEADAVPFGMTLADLLTHIREPKGRVALFGDGGFQHGTPEDETDTSPIPNSEELWGPSPTEPVEPAEGAVWVSIHNILDPVVLPPLMEGETPQSRLERVRASRSGGFIPKRIPGWTHFRWPGCHGAIPVFAPAKDGGAFDPHPDPSWAEGGPVYGVYKRVHDRLVRVWTQGGTSWWDVSTLQEDGTYVLNCQMRYGKGPISGMFDEQIRVAETWARRYQDDLARPPATHRCKVCEALWRLNPADPTAPAGSPMREETWSCLTLDVMGKCCDNEPMGDQIEPLVEGC